MSAREGRAVFGEDLSAGLEVEELTWADYLALASGSLAGVGLVPLAPEDREAGPVTLREGDAHGN